ncbi:hypothetical protein DIPPA_14110 [Diplonema papillatum]|nr:hypothetical protein DIPPA_14110 [Diplonema papillatum]
MSEAELAGVMEQGEPADGRDVDAGGECDDEDEQPVFCPGRIVRVAGGPAAGSHGEVLDRDDSGNVTVMFNDWLGGEQLVREDQLVATPWHKALSNSTSPGDHYWYNYDSGASVWEEPAEVKNVNSPAASTPTDSNDPATAQPSNETSCTSSDYDADPQPATKKRSLCAAAADAPGLSKEEELNQLRQRLLELERAKKRKLNRDADERPRQHPADELPDAAKESAEAAAQEPEYTGKANVEVVLQSRTVLDQRLTALLPKEHGLKAIPHLSVPLVD